MSDRFQRKHHNPHAHVIHKPGKRLMTHIPLRFVWNKVSGHGRKGVGAALNLVSFIDFLVVTTIFLLMSFSASGESLCWTAMASAWACCTWATWKHLFAA